MVLKWTSTIIDSGYKEPLCVYLPQYETRFPEIAAACFFRT